MLYIFFSFLSCLYHSLCLSRLTEGLIIDQENYENGLEVIEKLNGTAEVSIHLNRFLSNIVLWIPIHDTSNCVSLFVHSIYVM